MWVRQGLTDRMRTIQPGVSRQHDVRSALGLPQYWREPERTVVYDWWRAGLAMQFRYDERGMVAGMATLDSPVSPEGRTRCWQVGTNEVVLFLKLETRHPHATPGQPIDAKTRLSDNPKVLLNRHGEARAFKSKWCGYEHYLEGWTYFSVMPGKYTLRVATHGSPDVMASEYLPVPGWIIDVPGHVDGLYLGTLPVQAESDAGAGQRGLRYSPAPGPPAITDAGFAEARSVARDCGPEITLSRPY